MAGHFEKGAWVEEDPTVDPKWKSHEGTVIDVSDFVPIPSQGNCPPGRLYRRALSDEEIAAVYKETKEECARRGIKLE